MSLSSASSFPSFKEHISRNSFQWLLSTTAFAIWKKRLRNWHHFQCLNVAPIEKAWFYGKGITASMEYTLIGFSPNGKGMTLLNKVIVMVKDKKNWTIKDTMSIKIGFKHYRNYITWTRVKLPAIFWLLFSFQYYCQLVKGQL